MSDYQKEQIAALSTVRAYLAEMEHREKVTLKALMQDYLSFRNETDRFLVRHFAGICSHACYQNRLSACCSKDGIITFFADVLINAVHSDAPALDRIQDRLERPNTGFKCIYLAENGCMWQIKPIVCQMFLCDKAQKRAFAEFPPAAQTWETLKQKKKRFTWPDRPVLFDYLEEIAMKAGYPSSLMYLHNSPGLLRIKKLGMQATNG